MAPDNRVAITLTSPTVVGEGIRCGTPVCQLEETAADPDRDNGDGEGQGIGPVAVEDVSS